MLSTQRRLSVLYKLILVIWDSVAYFITVPEQVQFNKARNIRFPYVCFALKGSFFFSFFFQKILFHKKK